MQLSAQHKLRPRELFFALLGTTTCSGLGLLWFKMAPEMMQQRGVSPEDLGGMGLLLTSLPLQLMVFVLVSGLLAGGLATRMARGQERATALLAAGAVCAFISLVASVQGLRNGVLEEAPVVADDGWE